MLKEKSFLLDLDFFFQFQIFYPLPDQLLIQIFQLKKINSIF